MHKNLIEIESEYPIPQDVLVEHIAVCMQSLNFTGKINIVAHPFDNPENVKFDDYVAGTHQEGSFAAAQTLDMPLSVGAVTVDETPPVRDPYPLVTRVLDALRGKRNG